MASSSIIKKLLIFSSVVCIGEQALAQRFSRGRSSSSPGPSIGAMVLFGQGKMGNATDVLKRSMIHTPVAVFAGFNIKKFRLGLNYEYNLVGQSDDPANFSNQNIGGKANAPGVRFDYYNGKTAAGFVYRMSEKYTLDKPTINGLVSEYESKNGFSFQFYTQLRQRLGLVLDYSMGELKSSTGNSDDIKWDRFGVGFVFSNFAGGGASNRGRGRR
jgi:hypothetical protein